ncbi:MAG: hypothetical protein ACD_63C00258G0001 [uncultured bacterium]|nr:MAG: hypothetical protein ACD_63C00258G0001 [uncultured bacterium]
MSGINFPRHFFVFFKSEIDQIKIYIEYARKSKIKFHSVKAIIFIKAQIIFSQRTQNRPYKIQLRKKPDKKARQKKIRLRIKIKVVY